MTMEPLQSQNQSLETITSTSESKSQDSKLKPLNLNLTQLHARQQEALEQDLDRASKIRIDLSNKVGHLQDTRYTHDLANAVEKSQLAFGLDKYGITLDDVPDDQYNWQLMALEESVDMNQYLTREVRRLRGAVLHWTEKATRLAEEKEELFMKTQTLGLQKADLEDLVSKYSGELNDEYKKVWALEKQNEAYNSRITKLNSQVEGLEEVNEKVEERNDSLREKVKIATNNVSSLLDENEALKERVEHLQNYYNVHDPRGTIGPNGMDYPTTQQMKERAAHGISD